MALDADVVLTLSEQRSHAAESLLRAYSNARRTAVKEASFSQTYDQPIPSTSDLDLAARDLQRQRFLQFFSEFNQVAVLVLVGQRDDGNSLRTLTVSSIATVLDRSAVE
jgi:hypothetical protein